MSPGRPGHLLTPASFARMMRVAADRSHGTRQKTPITRRRLSLSGSGAWSAESQMTVSQSEVQRARFRSLPLGSQGEMKSIDSGGDEAVNLASKKAKC